MTNLQIFILSLMCISYAGGALMITGAIRSIFKINNKRKTDILMKLGTLLILVPCLILLISFGFMLLYQSISTL